MSGRRLPVALTIAGSDSGGGAGIQADLKTFFALGVYGASAITAITAQNTERVGAVMAVPAELVAAQIAAVLDDVGADAVKTGMLWNAPIVRAVARSLAERRARTLVVDPVLVASTGSTLLDAGGRQALVEALLPLATVVTPNLAEAAALAGAPVAGIEDGEAAARRILELGPRAVVVTGGHLAGDPVDVLVTANGVRRFPGRRLAGEAHGSGCVFSAALTAELARGAALADAVGAAKALVARALASPVEIGRGRPPLHPAA